MCGIGMQGRRTCTCNNGEFSCPMGMGSCVTGDGGGMAGDSGTAQCMNGGTCSAGFTCTQMCGIGMQGRRTCTCAGGEITCPMGIGSCVMGDAASGN
jgi:hypothetical protein